MPDNNKIIFINQTQKYVIIEFIGDKCLSLDYHQTTFTNNSKQVFFIGAIPFCCSAD